MTAMTGRLFTLDDANRALPLVRVIARDAVRRYRDAKAAISTLEKLKSDRRQGHPVPIPELARLDRNIEAHLVELRRLIEELEALGCRLRDYDKGVVDFPAACLQGDSFVFWCWALGEERVEHCHTEDERHLLGAATPA
jgi:hypothetical protein